MNPAKTDTPAQNAACAFLRDLTGAKVPNEPLRLASIRVLARQAGVSYVSMQKTVSALCQAGCLSAKRKTGLLCIGLVPPSLPGRTLIKNTKIIPRTQLAQQLEADILTGAFAGMEFLPSIKQLSLRYGVCYRTLRIRLSQLCERGILRPCAKRFALIATTQACGRLSLFLVSICNAQGVYTGLTPLRFDLLRSIEYECHARQIALRVFTCRFDLGVVSPAEGLDSAVSVARIQKGCIGTIVLPLMITGERLDEIFASLVRLGAPVAVIDESGEYACVKRPVSLAHVRHYTVSGGPGCGARMARFLLERGHRRAAFVTSRISAAWAVRRFAGFKEHFATHPQALAIPLLLEIDRQASQHYEYSNRAFDIMANSVGGLASITPATPEDVSTLTLDLIERLGRHVDLSARRTAFEPLVQLLQSDSAISALVCSNDVDAMSMLYLLRQSPQKLNIQVYGFDNTYEAAAQHLSSYHFDCRALANSVISALLYPQNRTLAPPIPKGGISEADGYVVERQGLWTSSGPAKES